MNTEYATRCPECKTRFQVTLDQINKAQGLVRCGTCLKVFAADQHLESAVQPSDKSIDNEATPNTKSAETKTTRTSALGTINQAQSDAIQSDKLKSNNYFSAKPLADSIPPHSTEEPLTAEPHIPDIPLQLRREQPHTSTGAFLGWSLLSLVTVVILSLQVLWFERDQLAQRPQFEVLYGLACQHLECRLSARQDLPSITSHQLIVRDHPKFLGAITIDLLMENTAPFDQPFPALQIVFTGLNGEPKAARIFQPLEYLGGDFENRRLMPSGRKIRINIDILDPGNQAPNYSLNFVPARNSLSSLK